MEKTEQTASANLIEELNKIFEIYTNELKAWREGKGKGTYLLDEDMFDVVIKLLDKSDKIKKLNVVESDDASEEKPQQKVRTLQDWTLSKKKV